MSDISFIRDYDREKRAEQDERRRRFIENYRGLPISGAGSRERAAGMVISALLKSRRPSYDIQADADEDRAGDFR